MRFKDFPDGRVILGSFPEKEVMNTILEAAGGKVPLVVTDPPYGKIVPESFDHEIKTDVEFCAWMISWTKELENLCLPGAAYYVWGGTGIPKFRPFYRFLVEVELQTNFQLSNHITWKKKRAIGTKTNYLYTREECAYLIFGNSKKPRLFNVPLLDEKRGYAGYSKKYPAKSEYYRRTNVWADITEIFRGKVHPTQKKLRVLEIPIEVHTQPGEFVLDMFAGSGQTALAARKLGRKFVLVEKDPKYFELICERLE